MEIWKIIPVAFMIFLLLPINIAALNLTNSTNKTASSRKFYEIFFENPERQCKGSVAIYGRVLENGKGYTGPIEISVNGTLYQVYSENGRFKMPIELETGRYEIIGSIGGYSSRTFIEVVNCGEVRLYYNSSCEQVTFWGYAKINGENYTGFGRLIVNDSEIQVEFLNGNMIPYSTTLLPGRYKVSLEVLGIRDTKIIIVQLCKPTLVVNNYTICAQFDKPFIVVIGNNTYDVKGKFCRELPPGRYNVTVRWDEGSISSEVFLPRIDIKMRKVYSPRESILFKVFSDIYPVCYQIPEIGISKCTNHTTIRIGKLEEGNYTLVIKVGDVTLKRYFRVFRKVIRKIFGEHEFIIEGNVSVEKVGEKYVLKGSGFVSLNLTSNPFIISYAWERAGKKYKPLNLSFEINGTKEIILPRRSRFDVGVVKKGSIAEVIAEHRKMFLKVIGGTFDKVFVVDPESIPEKPREFPNKLLKVYIRTNESKVRLYLSKKYRYPEVWKFNPKRFEWRKIGYSIEGDYIVVTLEDGGPFDEDGEKNGVIVDDIGITTSWWNESWKWRRIYNITSSKNQNITGFPAYIIVNTSKLISEGKMRGDCGDVRFTFWNRTSNSEEEIPYLFVGPCNSSHSLIWFRLPVLYDNSTSTTVFMYFGNPNATDNSDPQAVFPGLRAYWAFEEGSGNVTKDYSGNNFDGVLTDVAGGDPPLWRNTSSCVVGYCIESDDIGDAVNLSYLAVNGLDNVTFEAWIKTTDNRWGLISGANSGQDNEYLIYLETTPELRLYIKGSYDGVPPGSLTDGNWHHLVVVRNSDGTAEFYLDGSLLGTVSGLRTGTLTIDPNGLWLLQEQDSVGGSWDTTQVFIGLVDEVRIYNRSLSQDDIQKRVTNYTKTLVLEEYLAKLNVTIDYPSEGFVAIRYEPFWLNGTVHCVRGNCSNVSVYAQYIEPTGISGEVIEDTQQDFINYSEKVNVSIFDYLKLQPETGKSWWNESWRYRMKINISYTGQGNLTEYTVNVTIDTQSLITQGKMSPNCSDIVFTYYNQTTESEYEIPYWIESGCNTTNTVIWVRVPLIRNSTNETIYMYYGNPNAKIYYDPDDVFEYFVNFTKLGVQSAYGSGQDITPNNWEIVNDTILHLWGNNWKGVYYGPIKIEGDGSQILELYMNGTDTAEIYGVGFDVDLDNVNDARGSFYKFAGSQAWGLTPDQSYTNFGNWQRVYAILDDFSGQYLYFIFSNDDDADSNGNVWYKNVRVRKYATPEPTATVIGEEVLSIRPSGYYISKVIDLGSQDVRFGNIYWIAKVPQNTSLKVYTRSSSDGVAWSVWYEEINNTDVNAPDARYIQYKVEMTSQDPNKTPIFDKIVIEYTYTAPKFKDMKSSGTPFTTTNPYDCGVLDQTNNVCYPSFQVTPTEKGNFTLRLLANSTDTNIEPAESQWVNITVYERTYITDFKIQPSVQYKGGSVTISVRLLDASSNPIPNQNITFTDETDGTTIGSVLTDSNGYAVIQYNIPRNASLGYHTIRADYPGNSSLFYYSSWSTEQLKVSSSPQFWEIGTNDTYIGTGERVKIFANVTDEVGLDTVLVFITYPNGTEVNRTMTYNKASGYYEYVTEKLWEKGNYSFYIWANNTDGIENKSWTENFYLKIVGRLDVSTEKEKYKNFEILHLSNMNREWDMPGYAYRRWLSIYSNQTEWGTAVLRVDTKSLISEGKMNPDCSDIKFAKITTIEEIKVHIDNPYGVYRSDFVFPIEITDKRFLGKVDPAGRDIRIFTYKTDQPYSQEPDVPFWVESITSSRARIWIRHNLPINGLDLYIYYGKPGAESKSNYTAVFKEVVGEAGIVYTNDSWVNFSYLNSTGDTVFVFSSINTYYGSDEAFTRITKVNSSGFHVLIQESVALDQSHAYEKIGWIGFRKGAWIVCGKVIYVGNDSIDSNYKTVTVPYSFQDPVWVSQIQTFYETDPAHTRMNNPGSNSINIKIEETNTADTPHTYENVAYLVTEQFVCESGNFKIATGKKYHRQSSDVSATAGWTYYDLPNFPTTPVVVAKIMTERGGDNVHERIKDVTTDGFNYAMEEESGYDGPHIEEWNGYIAVTPGPIYGAKLEDTWPTTTIVEGPNVIAKTIEEIPHYLKSNCNQNDTEILVNLKQVSEGENRVYMYYGNPYDKEIENTGEDAINVFTYPSQYCSYVVLGIGGSSMDIVSYSHNNIISIGGTTITLNKGEYTTVSVSNGDEICSTGPISTGTQSTGDGAPAVPKTWAGKTFVVAVTRYNPVYFDIYALENATIRVYNSTGTGWTLVEEFSLSEGEYIQKSYPGGDSRVTTIEVSYLINSTGNILVFYRGKSDDYMPLTPANTELYLNPTQYLVIAAIYDNTNVNIYFSDGSSTTVTLNAGQGWVGGAYGSDGNANSVRIVSDKPIFAYQQADSDGTETTPGVSPKYMDRIFFFPQDAEYFVATTKTNKTTYCALYDTNGTLVNEWTVTASYPYPGKIGYGTGQDGTINIRKGYKLVCNESVIVIYEESSNDAETILYGPSAHAKIINVTYNDLGIEEDYYVNIENNGNETIRGYIYAIIQRFEDGQWVNVPPAIINDRASENLRVIGPGESLNLTYLWEYYGAWNTSSNPNGRYRVYVRFEDEKGNVITDWYGNPLEDYGYFEIIPADLSIINLTHKAMYEKDLEEYETNDTIDWINLTVTSLENTGIDTRVYLTFIDESGKYVGFGPNSEERTCGTIEENNTCSVSYGPVTIPENTGNLVVRFKVNLTAQNSGGAIFDTRGINFRYAVPLDVEEISGNNLINYPVMLILNVSDLINKGKVRSDLADLRVLDDKKKEVPRLILDYNETHKIIFFPTNLSANERKTYYLVYGNSSLSQPSYPDVYMFEYLSGYDQWKTISDSRQNLIIIAYFNNTKFKVEGGINVNGTLNAGEFYKVELPTNSQYSPLKYIIKTTKPVTVIIGSTELSRPNGATYSLDYLSRPYGRYFLTWGMDGSTSGNLTIFVTENDTVISVKNMSSGNYLIQNQVYNFGDVVHLSTSPHVFEINSSKPVLVVISQDDAFTSRDIGYRIPSFNGTWDGTYFKFYLTYAGGFYIVNPNDHPINYTVSGCITGSGTVGPKSSVLITGGTAGSLCEVWTTERALLFSEIYADVQYYITSLDGATTGKEFVYRVEDPYQGGNVVIGIHVLFDGTDVQDGCSGVYWTNLNKGWHYYRNAKSSGECRIIASKPIVVLLMVSEQEPSYTVSVPEWHMDWKEKPIIRVYKEISTRIFVHDIPSTFSSTPPERLYQNGPPVYYNFSMKNLWRENITNLAIRINCPNLPGLTCECVDNPGHPYCNVGNLTPNQEITVSFKITATEDTPTGNYIVNATVSYLNPLGNNKTWREVEPQTLEIRTYGIMEITVYSYPENVTRGSNATFKAYANNTGDQTAPEAWLAYSVYPSGWSIVEGSRNVTATNVSPGQIFWNNVTFYVSQSSSLGAQQVKLESGSSLDQKDFKVVTIYVYANTTLNIWLNDTDASRGEYVEVFAKLMYDNGTPVKGQKIEFYDETDNRFLGSSITNSQGIASVIYYLNESVSLGTHTINASYPGNSTLYLNPSENRTTLEVGLKPTIHWIEIVPSIVGYGKNVTIRANVTDDKGVSNVTAEIISPDGEKETVVLQNVYSTIYEREYSPKWLNGTYNVTVIAEDTSGSITKAFSQFQVEIESEILVETEKQSYLPTENVRLKKNTIFPLKYKVEIKIRSNESVNITEYQIMITFNSSKLISEGKMRDDCGDLRFSWLNKSSGEEVEIPYFLDYGCGEGETVVWVKVPLVYANNVTTIYMYYGNPAVTSDSSEFDVFTFEKENATTFWTVSSESVGQNLDIQAFLNNTSVIWEGSSQKIQNGTSYQLSSPSSQTSTLSHDKPIFGAFEGDTTEALHPISWAGKKFAYYVYRGTNEWHICAPFGDAKVQIYDGTTLLATYNIQKGNCIVANNDVTDGSVVIIESNESILVQHVDTTNNYDSRILYPVSTRLYGVPSERFEIAAIEDGTTVNIYCSDGYTNTLTLDRGQGWDYAIGGSEGTAPACVIISNKPVGANSLADSDGTETTTFLPLEELDRYYVFPQPVQYVAVAAPFDETTCTLYNPDGTVYDSQTAYVSGNAPGKIYFGSTTDGTNIQAGSYMICNKPVFAYYEYATTNDETQLFGPKANRKYSPRIYVESFGNETLAVSQVINYKRIFEGYIIAEVEKKIGESWVRKSVLVNDTTTGTRREFNLSLFDLSKVIPAWNPEGETGEFRMKIYVTDPEGNILNTTDGKLIGYAYFNVSQPPLKLNVSEIRVYETPYGEHGGGTLVDKGINKTFILESGKVYRFEIDVDVLSDSQTWNITEANVTFENLNQSWIIDVQNDVWYLNQTDTAERLGGLFTNGILKWNTSENDGTADNGTKVTFYFILNLTGASEEERGVLFRIETPTTIVKDFDTLKIIVPDTTPPNPVIYGLNTTEIFRGESVLAYAQWNEEIKNATIEYNSTTKFLNNYTIPGPYTNNWTNYTIETTSLWLLGRHYVRIYASDLSDNWNKTPAMYFKVYGLAYVSSISTNNSNPLVGDTVKITCLILDDTNDQGIENYNVSFWVNNSYIGSNLTNSSGYAEITYQFTSPGSYEIKCNITEDLDRYYKVDNRNEKSTTVFVRETEPPKWWEVVYPSLAHKGDTVNLSVRWKDNFELDYAILSTNESGTMENVSYMKLSGKDAWANFSYQIPTTISPGYIIWKQYANDTSNNWNVTDEYLIEVWGWAEVSNAVVNPSSIQQGGTTTMYCKIVDANQTTVGIEGYNVSFYLGNTLLGYNLTNSSGWAEYTFTVNTAGTYTVKCIIGDYPEKKYNASSKNEGSDTLTVSATEDIYPPQIVDNNYGLNATKIYRYDAILVYGQWNETIDTAWVEYNKTSSLITETVPGPYTNNWTNHTIVTDDAWTPGVHVVKLYANDTSGNINDTLPYLSFEMWGRSAVYWVSPNETYREVVDLVCQVKDYDTGSPISDYVVEFYNSTSYLGSNKTDSNGYARLRVDLSSYTPGYNTFYCKIVKDDEKYYDPAVSSVGKDVLIKGKLNVTIVNPENGSSLERGETYWLNSTTYDEFGNKVTPDSSYWFEGQTEIGSGENITWTVPSDHPLGPTVIKVNVTKQYYDPAEDNITVYIYGHSSVVWVSPEDGSYPSGSILELICYVNDTDRNSGISGYPVSFYYNGTLIGTSNTNSTGYAVISWDTSGLDGTYNVSCEIGNYSYYIAKKTSDSTMIEVYLDTTPPNVTIVSPENKSYNINTIPLNYTVQDEHLDSCWYELDGTNYSLPNCENTTLTNLQEGSHYVRVYANDTAGNVGYSEVWFTVDLTSPVITIISPENRTYGETGIWMNITLNEAGSVCMYSIDGGQNQTMNKLNDTYFYRFASVGEGTHKVKFFCNDTAGNWGSAQEFFTVDLTAPTVTLYEPENNSVLDQGNVTFKCYAEDNLKLINVTLYTNKSGSFSPELTNSSGINGNYTFKLTMSEGYYIWNCKACDDIRCSFYSENWSFYVDLNAPTVTVVSPENKSYNTNTIQLNYSASDLTLDSCWYELDGTNYSLPNCENTTLTNLAEGSHHLIVYANDSLGRVGYDEVWFRVDLTPPSLVVVSPENNTEYGTPNVPLEYSVSDNIEVDTCWYVLDGGQPTVLLNCQNTTLSLDNGPHNITVYVNDTAGNTNQSFVQFTVNSTAPYVKILHPVEGNYYNNQTIWLNYTVQDTDLDSCWYSIDGGDNVSIPNCQNITITVSDGSHNVKVYANDSLNQIGWDSVNFFVDTVPPSLVLISPENKSYSENTIWINYTVNDTNLDYCVYELDGSNTTVSDCSNVSLELSEGSHYVRVFAFDKAGNYNVTSKVWFTVDTTPPNVTIVSPENKTYTVNDIPLNYTVSDNFEISMCWYVLDSQEEVYLQGCQNTTLTNVPDGSHRIRVYANDSAGNVGYSEVWFTVDTRGPNIYFVPPTPGDNQAIDYNWTYINITTDEDASIAILEFDFNNGTVLNFTMNQNNPRNWWYNVTDLQDGTYYYRVHANDTFGNWNTTAWRTVRISVGAPAINIISPENKTYKDSNYIQLNVTVNKEVSAWWYSINNGRNITFTPNISIAARIGSNVVRVYANDSAGNVGYSEVWFTVDTTFWEDKFDHYSGLEIWENITIENGSAKIRFCYPVFEPDCWKYRVRINVSNPDTQDHTDVQLNLTVDTQSLISEGKMNGNCSDIRFTYYNQTSGEEYEIPYYIESGCNTTSTIIWVKVPFVPAGGSSIIYMYYGNPGAQGRSNISEVFNYYNNIGQCNGSVAGGSCSVIFDAPAGEVFYEANLTMRMAGDFGYGGSFSSDAVCDENYERANLIVDGSVIGCYSTGIDGCTLNEPPGMPVSIDVRNKGSVNVTGDSTDVVNLDPNNCGFYYKFEFEISGYTRKNATLEYSVGTEEVAIRNAKIRSIAIKPRKVARWLKFYGVHSIPTGTGIEYRILDSNNNTLLVCNSETAQTGCDLSGINAKEIKLEAVLTTNSEATPELMYWNVSWTPNSSVAINVINETSGTISNALIRILRNGTVLAEGYGSVVVDVEIYENYTVETITGTSYGDLLLRLFELNVTKDTIEIKEQIVENYTGNLPQNIWKVTPVVALNDTDLNYSKATLVIPKGDVQSIDYILHCTDWNYTSATCNNWVTSDPNSYEGFGENSTHFWFNVTGFQAYAGGTVGYDVQVNEITFNKTKPVENETVLVTANVSNEGSSDLTNVTIRLEIYLWNETSGSWILDESYEKNVSIPVGNYTLVNFTWTAKIGTYNFTVIADPYDQIDEVNESNNANWSELNVSAWTIYYGHVNGWIVIGGNNGENFTVWIPYMIEGNLYFADQDSSFEFENLMPLNGTNDLEELDEALNMSIYKDSVSNVYDKDGDGVPDHTDCFSIGNRLLCDVPVVNSTEENNGNFVTGILWDSGDGGTEYNGTQDVVFITKVNYNKTGSFGRYDYEVRIPALLRDLKGTVDKIVIYVEIK